VVRSRKLVHLIIGIAAAKLKSNAAGQGERI